ncbi:MAG: ABC transporter ATP-binding protein [Planctomycetota bacterium]|nr:ABC transporter ATP-binding protein [Planctomycetota bacterium]
MPLLELEDVDHAYGTAYVLRRVTLALTPGVFTAVVGPNGAGKTTLLRLAGGWLVPTAGSVRLDGESLAAVSRRGAARRIAAVPSEEAAVFPFTVRDTVLLGRHPWRGVFRAPDAQDAAAIEDALRRTGLLELAERPVPALSSGERQRVAIARCLAQRADVCLLDEPTAHLDLGQRQRMLALFRQEARVRGCSVLAVLHDLNLAAAFADRIVLLVRGEIVADGSPAQVLTAEGLSAAFETPVQVVPHPSHGGPLVLPAAEISA